jgi:hypothetical protein
LAHKVFNEKEPQEKKKRNIFGTCKTVLRQHVNGKDVRKRMDQVVGTSSIVGSSLDVDSHS